MAAANGSANGKAEVNGILKHDADKGAPVHTFDPASSPSEKASSAGKARDQLKSVKESEDVGGKGAFGMLQCQESASHL